MVHDSSSSGNTVFVEPKTVIGLGNRLAALDGRIREEEEKGFWLSSVLPLQSRNDVIDRLMAVLLKLDLALARGRYGQWLGAVPPRLEPEVDAPFHILELRHPLLVWQQRKEGGAPVVPVSVEVSEQFAGCCHYWTQYRWQNSDVEEHWFSCIDGQSRHVDSVQRQSLTPLVCASSCRHRRRTVASAEFVHV